MAEIPTFTSRGRVTTGSPFARNVRAASGAGAEGVALARLGSALSGLSQDIVQATKGFGKVAAAQEEKDYKLARTDKLIDFKLEIEKEFLARQEGAVDGANGFTTSYEEYVGERTEAYIKEHFPGREDDEELRVRFKQTADGFVSSAARFEVDRRINHRGSVVNKLLDNASSVLASEIVQLTKYKDVVSDDGGFDYETATGAAYEKAVATVEDTLVDQFGDNPTAFKAAQTLTKERLQKEWLQAWATANPKAYIDLHDGAFTGTPKKVVRRDFKTIHDAASSTGLTGGHEVLSGIYKLESNNGKIDRPRRRDGTLMSSALGPWQILKGLGADLGLSRADAADLEKSTPAVAAYLKNMQNGLAKAGLPVTPATTYMNHNIGPAATKALLRANPNAEVSSVLRRVWASKGERWIRTALNNNPSMYRPGQTVGQVLENYKGKMSRAMASNAKFFTGTEVDTDARIQEAVREIAPFDPELIDSKSAADIYQKTLTAWKVGAKENAAKVTANAFYSGDTGAFTLTEDQRKQLDDVILVDAAPIIEGDLAAHNEMVKYAERGHVPETASVALGNSVIVAGDTPGKAASFMTLARISNDHPIAYKEMKLDGDVRDRVDDFRALVDVQRISPGLAINLIDQRFSPEGKAERKAVRELVKNELRNGQKKEIKARAITWGVIENYFDGKYGTSMFSDADASQVQKEIAVDTYASLYENRRLQGNSEEMARNLALKDMDKTWGVTNLDGASRITPAPPETNYPAVGGSHDYITTQARNYVEAELAGRGQFKEGDSHPELQVMASSRTMDDVRNGRALPRYNVAFRRADGLVDLVRDVSFDPAYADEVYREEQIDAEIARRKAAKDDKASSGDVGLDGAVDQTPNFTPTERSEEVSLDGSLPAGP